MDIRHHHIYNGMVQAFVPGRLNDRAVAIDG